MEDVLEKCFGNIFVQGFRSDSGGPIREVWSDIASSVCELSLVWRRLNIGFWL